MKKFIVAHPERGDIDLYSLKKPNVLEFLQFMVDGYIEVAHLAELDEQGIVLIVNEEGLLNGLEPNENLFPFFFVGDVVFVAVDGEDFVGLNDEQIEFLRGWIGGLTDS